ncbi:MAG: PKD domain-containing protein [Bacteroidales bacterium]
MKKIRLILSVLSAFLLLTFVFSSCNKDEEPEEPDVSFDFTNNYHKAPIEVEFTNTTQANDFTINSWEWEFGDETTSTEKNPTHEYTEAGSHSITLKGYYDDDEYRAGNGYLTVYGDLTRWAADKFYMYDAAWAGEELPVSAYMAVWDAQGNLFDHSGTNQYIIWDIEEEDTEKSIQIYDYDYPLNSGSIKVSLHAHSGGDNVNPNTDREIYSTTIDASDFHPEDEDGPYNPNYNGDAAYSFTIDWLED